jgi:hypothetical protein
VQAIVTIGTASWYSAAILREQLSDLDIGLLLEEAEAGKCPEWKNIANCSPTHEG